MQRYFGLILIFGMLFSLSLADEEDNDNREGVKKKFEDVFPLKDVGDWFKNAGEEIGAKAESSAEAVKEFSDQAKEKSEGGIDAMKNFASGIGERFNKAKDRLEESGEKMKEAVSSAAEKSKDEFGAAASKVSEFAKEVPETLFSMFKF